MQTTVIETCEICIQDHLKYIILCLSFLKIRDIEIDEMRMKKGYEVYVVKFYIVDFHVEKKTFSDHDLKNKLKKYQKFVYFQRFDEFFRFFNFSR